MDRKDSGNLHSPRIDFVDFTVWVSDCSWHRNVEPVSRLVPDGLLHTMIHGSPAGIYAEIRKYSLRIGDAAQHSTMFLGDEGHERGRIGIIGDQDNVISRIISQLIRAKLPARGNGKRRGIGCVLQIYHFRRAVAITRPKLMLAVDDEDTGGARSKPVAGVTGKAGDREQKLIVFGVDHINAASARGGRTIG